MILNLFSSHIILGSVPIILTKHSTRERAKSQPARASVRMDNQLLDQDVL